MYIPAFYDLLGWFSPQLHFRLLAKSGLQQLTEASAYQWQASSDDPQFKLKRKGFMPQGWYMLSLQLNASISRLDSKCYVDYGDGIDEAQAICLSLISGKLAKRICYFDKQPISIRFDPSTQACQFSVTHLQLSKLTPNYAKQLMLKKLNSRHHSDKFVGLSGDELYGHYDACFNRVMQHISYPQWQAQVEQVRIAQVLTELQRHPLAYQPVISIVMATYNTQPLFLRACIESVIAQSYPHWQLCIADDCSTDADVIAIIEEYALQDARICWIKRTKNGHIARATNSAISLANGEYVGFLDHDDCLAEHALWFVAHAINQQPDVKIIYSDEDKIDESGQRFEPHFKTDWNRDLFYSHNYISHFTVIEAQTLAKAGGCRGQVNGSQDYDLLLRCVAIVGNKQIAHIPYILYHWRAAIGSTALSASQKSYTTKAGLTALTDFFAETGIGVKAEQTDLANCFRVLWPLPTPKPLVSLIIPTRDGLTILKQCIDSIISKTDYPHFEIIVVNNQSRCAKTLVYLAEIAKENNIRVLDYDAPFNYSAINNLAVTYANGTVIGLINNDIEVINPQWLDEMVRHASRPDIGCVGAKLRYSDGSIQHAGVILGIGGVAGHAHKYYAPHQHGYFSRLSLVQNFSAVTAAALVVRKSVYEEVAGLDEELSVAFNDIDFCLKVREAGYRNLWTPYAELYHHESVSRGHEDSPEKQQRFAQEIAFMQHKWGDALIQDPYYSPNLSLVHEDFSLRF